MAVQAKISGAGQNVAQSVEQTVNGSVSIAPGGSIALNVSPEMIAGYSREGADLIVQLKSGETIRITDFYAPAANPSHLYLVTEDQQLVSAELGPVASSGAVSASYVPVGAAAGFAALQAVDSDGGGEGGGGGLGVGAILGGVALAGGAAALAGGGGGDDDGPPLPNVLDTTPPTAATGLAINAAGTQLTGNAEAGATVRVDTNGDGTPDATAVVGSNGQFTVPLNPPLTNGETVSVTVRDAAGNTSPPATVTAADTTPPQAATGVEVSEDGTTITGNAEPGTTVWVDVDGDGEPDHSAETDANGDFEIPIDPPLIDGETVSVFVTDTDGNDSDPVDVTAPDLVPTPLAPVINPSDGTVITGTADANTTVTLTGPNGVVIGTAQVDANGDWTVTPATPLANGTLVTGVATNSENESGPPAAITIDAAAPDAPVIDPSNGVAISGTAEAGAQIDLTDGNGAVIGTTTVDASGNWSFTANPALADGSVINAVARDAAGNESGPVSTVVDALAPALPTVDASNGAVLAGTAEADATITLTRPDGSVIGTTVADGAGNWTFAPTPALADGLVVSVVASDAVGNDSPVATVTIDAAAPAAPVIAASNGAEISGTAEANSEITLTGPGGAPIGTATADANGAWSFTPGAPLANGTVVQATATDAVGNVSGPAATIIDSVAPAAPAIDPSNGGTISGTAEPGSEITLTGPGGTPIGTATADANGDWTFSPNPALGDGIVVDATATDAAGNESLPTSVTVDAVAPPVPVISPSNGVNLVGTAEPDSVITLTAAGGAAIGTTTTDANGNWSFAPTPALADDLVVNATATDAAGNVSQPGTVTIDTSLPSIPFIEPSNGALIEGTADAGNQITVTDSLGNPIGITTADANGNWSVTPGATLPDGTIVLAVAQNPGGIDSAAGFVTVDGLAPAAPVIDASNGSELSGTAEAGAVVTLTDGGGGAIGTVTADANGDWSFTPNPALLDGTTVNATATDPSGNESLPATTTIDATAPAAPVIDPSNGVIVSGTAEIGSIVTLTNAGGTVIGSAVTDANGEWTVIANPAAADGAVITATASDAAGNDSPPATVTVDGLAPAAPTIDASNGVTISGTAEPDSSVTLTGPGGAPIGVAQTDANGDWTFTAAPALANGVVITAVASDAAGNTSGPVATIVDSIAPPAPAIALSNGSVLTGTAEANSEITLTGPGGTPIGTATAGANGVWSFTPTTPIADGTLVTATATDAAGNVSGPSTVTVDSLAPVIQIAASNGATVSGTAEAGSVITLTDGNGAPIGTTTTNGAGVWLFTPSPALANATVVNATATDATGNVSGSVTITVDSAPPAAPVIDLSDGSVLTGTAEAGALVTLSEAGVVIGTVTADTNGDWSFTPPVPLLDGTEITATARDTAGNISPQASVTIDAIAPLPPVINPSTGAVVTGTAEANSEITLTDGNGAPIGTTTADANGDWSFTPGTALGNGTTVQATATDATGNVSPVVSTIVDSAAPLVPVLDPSNGSVISGTAEVGALVTLSDGATQIAQVRADANGDFSFTPPTPIANGVIVTAIATDAAGNPSPAATVTIDGIAPPAPVIDPSNGTVASGTAEANSEITLTDGNGAPIGTVTTDGAGNWTLPLSPALGNGVIIQATATDASGNVSPPAAVTVDTILPNLPTIDASDGDVFTGTAEAGSVVTLTGTGLPVGATATTDANGNWTYTAAPQIADGVTVTVTAADLSGNVSAPASIIVDDVAPLAPVIAATNGIQLVGTAEANATVTLSAGGVPLGTTTADANGNWAFTPSPAILNGVTVSATATDAAGNEGPADTEVVDTSLPSIPVIDASNGAVITGTADPGDIVLVTDGNGVPIGDALVDINGDWTVTPGAPLPDGTVIVAVAVNPQTTTSAPATTVVDAIDPAAPVIDPSNGTEISGIAEAGATITLTDGLGDPIGTTTADINGNWSFTPTVPLLNGIVINATATDAAGNESLPDTETVDAIAPGAPVLAPSNGVIVSGTAEANSVVTLTSGVTPLGQVTADGAGNFSFTPSPALANGVVVTATATDAAGNTGLPGTGTIDALAPAAPTNLVFSPDGVTLTGNAEANSQIRIVVNGDTANPVLATTNAGGVFTVTFAPPLAAGQDLTLTATDAARNTSPAAAVEAPDLAQLTLTVAEAADGYINAAEIANGIQVNIGLTTGTDVGDTVTVRFTGQNGYIADQTHVVTAAERLAGNFNLTLTPPANMAAYPEGLSSITASVSGGPASAAATFTVDTIRPTTPVLSLVGNILTVAAEPGTELTVSVNLGGVVANVTVTANNAGLASVNLLTDLDIALTFDQLLNTSVSVRGEDLAGNPSNVATIGVGNVLEGQLVTLGNFGLYTNLNIFQGPLALGINGTAEPGGGVRAEVSLLGAVVTLTPTVQPNGDFQLNLLSGLGLNLTQLLNLSTGNGLISVNIIAEDRFGNDSATYGLTVGGPNGLLNLGPITITGTAGNDVLSGTDGSTETINAGAGSDLIFHVGAGDSVVAGDGNDTIQIVATNFATINGGAGFDTIVFDNGIDLDYNSPGTGSFSNIERIDLGTGDSGSVLTLTASEVDAITDAGNVLQITGEANDTLNVVGAVDTGTTQTVGGLVYDVYTFGNTTLLVEDNTVTVVH